MPPALLAALAIAASGCATPRSGRAPASDPTGSALPRRTFTFPNDTVGFTNETRWIYHPAPNGSMTHEPRVPPPTYSLRCFVVARLNRQFFDHARFQPDAPKPNPAQLRKLVASVVRRSSRRPSPDAERVVIPGWRDLRELSEAEAPLLRELAGGASLSYVQRGHWRMIFPFGPRHQTREAQRIFDHVHTGRPALVHLVRFPQLTINHAVLVHAARQTPEGFEFDTADPNDPDRSHTLRFDARQRHFLWPPNTYFAGGRVDAYEVFRNAIY